MGVIMELVDTKDDNLKPGEKVNTETALQEFDRFLEAWDIDADVADMEEEDLKSFEDCKRKIVRAIKLGRASLNDDGSLSYVLIEAVGATSEIKMKIPSGSSYMSMDKHKDRKSIHKLYSFMAEASGTAPAIFSKMDGRDIKFFMGVSLLFLAS